MVITQHYEIIKLFGITKQKSNIIEMIMDQKGLRIKGRFL